MRLENVLCVLRSCRKKIEEERWAAQQRWTAGNILSVFVCLIETFNSEEKEIEMSYDRFFGFREKSEILSNSILYHRYLTSIVLPLLVCSDSSSMFEYKYRDSPAIGNSFVNQ
jgi:hypothetical protein